MLENKLLFNYGYVGVYKLFEIATNKVKPSDVIRVRLDKDNVVVGEVIRVYPCFIMIQTIHGYRTSIHNTYIDRIEVLEGTYEKT